MTLHIRLLFFCCNGWSLKEWRVRITMINIFTDLDRFNRKEVILDNDAYFYENVTAENFGDLEEEIIKQIDNGVIIDKKLGTVKTLRGITSIDNLSTGCKTVLNYVYISKNKNEIKAIDASYCGYNALEVLFLTIEKVNYPINIIIRHKDNLFKCNDREYKINNKRIIKNLLYI